MPRIKRVEAVPPFKLRVYFENGVERYYNCEALLHLPQFHLLKDPGFFKAVRVDPGGYGISWNDDLDLSEYELWTNGKTVELNPVE
ncbi:MAG: DUF2442 domain-containing protein [Candidatus Sumerlaeia bacterium]|nr:DUF2442 domain-containing protein [Candidatus Sumerlaeia bacterium]